MRVTGIAPRPRASRAAPAQGPARLFWTYWIASAISQVGDGISALALPLTAIKLLHASALEISLLTAASFAAWAVIGLPAGAVVHRWPLRRAQVAADVVRAAALASVPVAAVAGALSVAQLVGVALVIGLASVVFDVANSTFVVSVVPREQLTARNSLISGTTAVTQTGGPSLGGALVSLVGAAAAVLFDVGSYLASAVLLSRMPAVAATARPDGAPVRRAVRDGLRFVFHHPVIGPCAAIATTINFICGALLALGPVYLVRTLHAPVGLVGLLIASEGVGTLLGASVTPRLARRVGSARLLIRATAVGGLLSLLIPLAGSGAAMALFAVGNAGFAAGVVVASILARTHRQEASPPHLLPRVTATVRFVSWGVIPLGAVAGGTLGQLLGLRAAVAAFCGLSLTVPLIGLATRVGRLRDLGETRATAP